jgi:Ca2+/H+ antiporter, TMEM165/GDT1 family
LIDFSFPATLASFAFVVLAEMGDKTQLLAMSFAARCSAAKVLLAVFIATIANHAIAVAAGQLLVTVLPLDIISFAASLSFIGFGLWTIRGDSLNGKNTKMSRFGVVATVAIAFFIAEFGDKTQLATISLAVQYQNPVSVLTGSTLGMLVADGVGIVIGVVLCRRIPQKALKWFSAAIFMAFGVIGVYEVLNGKIGSGYLAAVIAVLAAFAIFGAYFVSTIKKKSNTTDADLGKAECEKPAK